LDGDTSEIVAELIYGTPSKTVPAKLWSDPTSDPLADLRGAMRLVSSQCGSSADLVIMGKNATDAFESNANVLAAYDKMRIAPGVLTTKNLSWGVQSLGTYRGVPLYVNESEYQDSDNSDEAVRARRQRADRLERSSGLLRLRGSPSGRSGRAHDPRLRGRAHPDDQLQLWTSRQDSAIFSALTTQVTGRRRSARSRRASARSRAE
jgi:Phage major capsid protein E